MNPNAFSTLAFYSFGISAENKPENTDLLHVTPIEVTPFVDGEIGVKQEEVSGSGVDHMDRAYTVTATMDRAIPCRWFALNNTNRRTAPDIRVGERILIWRHGDDDIYYWSSLGIDDWLRRLETVIWTFSATDRDEDEDATLPENCYSLEVCTRTKQITLRTVKGLAKGGRGTTEPFAYTLQLNTAYGAFVLTDDVGNYIELDSPEDRIILKNRQNSVVHLDKKYVFINGDKEVRIKSGATEQIWTPGGVQTYTPLKKINYSGSDSGFRGIKTNLRSPKKGL